ncbi:uncharacterized protein LOC128961555 [Oppia nitens]|uniref:uncharacterized protein LOC128961555 n=1 Tax=Oppia nitens TaxID=1686743 RepID=UPI0023DBBF2C|nr:uncharacterized protein LOC128961555 [Oppia nitens]
MSEAIYGLTDVSNRAPVDEIRKNFLLEVSNSPDLYDKIDVERVSTEDWEIERFILCHKNIDKAFEELIKSIQWKKSYGLHDRDHTYFPKELVHIFGYEKFSRDTDGRVVGWIAGSRYKKIGQFSPLIYQYGFYVVEMIDRMAGNKGWTVVADHHGAGLANVDMNLFYMGLEALKYYPMGFKLMINIDLPWLLNSIIKFCLTLLPKSLHQSLVFIKRNQLTNYININDIPVPYGGVREVTCELTQQIANSLNYD